MKRVWKESAGFSLLETVFAMGLFALCMLSTIQLAARVVQANQLARDDAAALGLAADKMETIKSIGYGSVASGFEPQVSASNRFQRRTTVYEQSSPRLKRVIVTVSWRGITRRRQVALATIVVP